MHCPLNGPRNINEFIYGGEVNEMPDPKTTTDRDWAHYIFHNENLAGVVKEWWMHGPSSYWFIAERNTVTDEIIRTYDSGEIYSTRIEFDAVND